MGWAPLGAGENLGRWILLERLNRTPGSYSDDTLIQSISCDGSFMQMSAQGVGLCVICWCVFGHLQDSVLNTYKALQLFSGCMCECVCLCVCVCVCLFVCMPACEHVYGTMSVCVRLFRHNVTTTGGASHCVFNNGNQYQSCLLTPPYHPTRA